MVSQLVMTVYSFKFDMPIPRLKKTSSKLPLSDANSELRSTTSVHMERQLILLLCPQQCHLPVRCEWLRLLIICHSLAAIAAGRETYLPQAAAGKFVDTFTLPC
jgi:hypothetical protein